MMSFFFMGVLSVVSVFAFSCASRATWATDRFRREARVPAEHDDYAEQPGFLSLCRNLGALLGYDDFGSIGYPFCRYRNLFVNSGRYDLLLHSSRIGCSVVLPTCDTALRSNR